MILYVNVNADLVFCKKKKKKAEMLRIQLSLITVL